MADLIRFLRPVLFTLLLLLALTGPAGNVLAHSTRNVLVLHSYNYGYTWTDGIQQGIGQEFSSQDDYLITTFVEYLDADRFLYHMQAGPFTRYIKQKYNRTRIDGIILTDDHAYRLFMENLRQDYPRTPVFFVDVEEMRPGDHLPEFFSGNRQNLHVSELLSLITDLQPDLETLHVYTLQGVQPFEESIVHTILNSAALKKHDVRVELREGLTLDRIAREAATLTGKDALMIPLGAQDEDGNFFDYDRALSAVAPGSGAPAYHHNISMLGQGIVGGPMNCAETEGKRAGQAMVQYFRSGTLPEIGWTDRVMAFDLKYVRRHQLRSSAIPASALLMDSGATWLSLRPWVAYLVTGLLVLAALLVIFLTRRNRRKSRELARLSYRAGQDSLTRLHNRLTLETDLLALGKLMEFGDVRSLTLVFIDLDNFKDINDNYGHDAGDAVLRDFADHLKKTHLPGLEKAYRFAGDEFILLMKDQDELDLEILVSNLQDLFLSPITLPEGTPVTISGSVGIAGMPVDTRDISQLISLADQAMYYGKKTGKNRIVFYPEIHQGQEK